MPEHTSMNDVLVVEIVYRFENLLDSLRSILFGELALVADPIEELTTSGQLCNDIVLVLTWSAEAKT